MMNTLQFATLGGLVAIITLVFNSGEKLKDFMKNISNLWLERINLDDNLSAAVYLYCIKNMKMIGPRSKVLAGCTFPIKNKAEEQLLGFEILKETTLYFRKGIRTAVLKPGEWKYNPMLNEYRRTVDLCLPRIMWNSEEFIGKCLRLYNECKISRANFKKVRFSIRKFYGKNKSAPTVVLDETKQPNHLIASPRELLHEVSMGRAVMLDNKIENIAIESNGVNPFDWYAFSDKIMDSVENVRQWYRSKQWYQSKHIPWRRGWLIHGNPGTGKTLLVKCVAKDLDMPVFLFDIASMNNEEFETFWNTAHAFAPCMILLEDFDAVFNGRENITATENKLSFDCLLNCISGIECSEGILMVITTNHIDKIDLSLGIAIEEGSMPTRPGRIDDIIQISNMDRKCREIMARRILNMKGSDLDSFMNKTEGMTAAQFTEMCNRHALQMIPEKEEAVFEMKEF